MMPAKRDALFINYFARPPEANTRDPQSHVITRPLVPSDMVAFGSQHGSAGPGLVQKRFDPKKGGFDPPGFLDIHVP